MGEEQKNELDFDEPRDGGMVPDSTPDEIEEVEEVEEVIEEQPDDEATVVAQLPLDVIEEAVGYGLTSKEIEQLGSEDNIAAVLQILDRRHDDTTEEVQSEATVGDDPDDPFADPEENTGVNSEVAELRKQVQTLSKMVKTNKKDSANTEELFGLVGKEYSELFGVDDDDMTKTQQRNRDKAVEEFNTLKAGYSARKRNIPSNRRLFKQAIQSVFGEFEGKVARKQFADSVNKRNSQFISRVNSRDNKKPQDGRSVAIDNVKRFLADRGYADMSPTETFD